MSIELFGLLLIAGCLTAQTLPVVPKRYRVLAALAVAGFFVVLAPFVLDDFRLFQLTKFAIWAIVAIGLNLLTGYNGQISLGHGAFVLLGGYVAAILMDDKSQVGFVDGAAWPFWTTIIAAAMICGVAGFMLGFPALRLTGPYLAIATLALIISAPQIIRKYDDVTAGSQGLYINQPPPPPGLESAMNDDQWMYALCMGVAIVMLIIAWSIVRGPLGRSFVAVRDSETAAAMGINVSRTKLIAFTISAVYAGVAGALLTFLLEVMTPESVRIEESINFLTAIVIGGLASLLGAIVGALVIVLLSDAPELVSKLPFVSESFVKSSGGAIQGILVIVVVLLVPYGFAGTWHRLVNTTPRAMFNGLRAVPGGIRTRIVETRESLLWTWEGMPWNRDRIQSSEPKEGG